MDIGHIAVFHSFPAQEQLSFWTFEEILAPYAQTSSSNADPSCFFIYFGAFVSYSAHMPKTKFLTSQLPLKASLFPGERLHS